jgi:hypothetical protein
MANKNAKLFADREMRSEQASFKTDRHKCRPGISLRSSGLDAKKRRGTPEQAWA